MDKIQVDEMVKKDDDTLPSAQSILGNIGKTLTKMMQEEGIYIQR
jgi:hypothetical protein